MYEESTCILKLVSFFICQLITWIVSRYWASFLVYGFFLKNYWCRLSWSRASIHIISAESWQFVSMYFHFTGTFRWVGNTFGKVVALGYCWPSSIADRSVYWFLWSFFVHFTNGNAVKFLDHCVAHNSSSISHWMESNIL